MVVSGIDALRSVVPAGAASVQNDGGAAALAGPPAPRRTASPAVLGACMVSPARRAAVGAISSPTPGCASAAAVLPSPCCSSWWPPARALRSSVHTLQSSSPPSAGRLPPSPSPARRALDARRSAASPRSSTRSALLPTLHRADRGPSRPSMPRRRPRGGGDHLFPREPGLAQERELTRVLVAVEVVRSRSARARARPSPTTIGTPARATRSMFRCPCATPASSTRSRGQEVRARTSRTCAVSDITTATCSSIARSAPKRATASGARADIVLDRGDEEAPRAARRGARAGTPDGKACRTARAL